MKISIVKHQMNIKHILKINYKNQLNNKILLELINKNKKFNL